MKALAAPQIQFSLGNPPPQQHTIYVGAEPSDNRLSLLLSCTSDAEVTSATLEPYSKAGTPTGSLFYLELTPLALDPDVLKDLEASAAGWKAEVVSGVDGDFLALSAAGAPVQLEAGVPVEFSIGNFAMATAPAVSGLQLMTYNVAGVATGGLPASSYSPVVFAQPPSGKGSLADALAFTFIPADGVGTSIEGAPVIENILTLTLSAVPGPPVAQAGPETVFKLQPVYGTDQDGFGALMTAKEASNLSIASTSGWQASNDDQLHGRAWLLKPSAGNLPTTQGDPVSFSFGPFATYFQPGPTVLLLEYSGVPGFADGAFAVTVEKQAHVVIDSFSVDPPVSTLSGGSATVRVDWQTENATRLTLYVDGEPQDVTDLSSQSLTIGDTTQLRLVAEGPSPGLGDNRAEATAIAEVKAVIERFEVYPAAIWPADCDPTYPVTLSWDVESNDEISLASSAAGLLGTFKPSGSMVLDVATPQTFTLTTADGVTKTIALASLRLEPQLLDYFYWPGGGAFSPGDPLFAVADLTMQATGYVKIYSLETRQRIATLALGPGQSPGQPAFSADGTTLLVPNSGGTVSVFAVKSESGSYSFTPLPSIPVVSAAFVSSVTAPDGTIYAVCGEPPMVSIFENGAGGYRCAGSVTVDPYPYQCALAPDGKALYTANYLAGSISRLDLTQSPPAVSTALTGLGGPQSGDPPSWPSVWQPSVEGPYNGGPYGPKGPNGPTGLGISPDGRILLVSNSGSATGYALPSPSGAVGAVPPSEPSLGTIAMLPTGDYALLANFPVGLKLINYARWTTSAEILTYPSAYDWQYTVGVTLSPDGSLAAVQTFVGVFGPMPIWLFALIDPPPPGLTSKIHVGEKR